MSKEMMKHAEGAISKHEKHPKHGIKHTRIHHHNDGSHTVHHEMHPDENGMPQEEQSYAVPDMAGLHEGLDQHLGAGAPADGGGAPADGAAA